MRRLLPDPAEVGIAEQLAELDLPSLAPRDRPYVVSNFALTVDGRATISGRAGPIGTPTDKEVLHRLRAEADALLVGAQTVRVERYGRPLPGEELRRRRAAAGLPPEPLTAIVTGSLELPWDAGVFTSGESRVLILTSSDLEVPNTQTPVDVERHAGHVDLRAALETMRRERAIHALLCEGGPHLHAELLAEGLIDELFVTVAPKLAGGRGPGLLEGIPEEVRDLEPVWLLEHDRELFARYRLRESG